MTVNLDLINQWYAAQIAAETAKKLIKKEQDLRKKVIESFKELKEGVNTFDLGQSYALKISYKVDRKITATPEEIQSIMNDVYQRFSIDPSTVVKYIPELKIKEYKAMPQEIVAVLDNMLTIKPGSHSMEIVKKKD